MCHPGKFILLRTTVNGHAVVLFPSQASSLSVDLSTCTINDGNAEVSFAGLKAKYQTVPSRESSPRKVTFPTQPMDDADDEFDKCFLRVSGMTCGSCVNYIEKSLIKVDGKYSPGIKINPYNAEICVYKPWRPKGLLNLKSS